MENKTGHFFIPVKIGFIHTYPILIYVQMMGIVGKETKLIAEVCICKQNGELEKDKASVIFYPSDMYGCRKLLIPENNSVYDMVSVNDVYVEGDEIWVQKAFYHRFDERSGERITTEAYYEVSGKPDEVFVRNEERFFLYGYVDRDGWLCDQSGMKLKPYKPNV